MSRPIIGSDRGIDGWYQAVEIDRRYQGARIGESVAWGGCRWRIVGISKVPPLVEGNAVVRLLLTSNGCRPVSRQCGGGANGQAD